jgi:hypothetical protein
MDDSVPPTALEEASFDLGFWSPAETYLLPEPLV